MLPVYPAVRLEQDRPMGSLRFGGIRFKVFSHDHRPRHAHGRYAEVDVIVEFWPGGARLADRKDAVLPPNAKQRDVTRIVKAAVLLEAELNRLWEKTHGTK